MDPAPQPQAPRTCPKHAIVLDPLGHCVICRRAEVEEDPDPSGARGAITALVLLGLAIVGVAVYRNHVAREPPRVETIAHAPALPEPPERDPAFERDEAIAARDARAAVERRAAVEKQMLAIPIRMYAAPRCDLCATARAFLKSKGYAHTEIDVEASAEAREALRALNPEGSVPTIVVGDEVIVGFGASVVMGAVYRAARKGAR